MKVGMRTLKTALAVAVSIVLSTVFNMDGSFFAGVAAVVTMQSSVTASVKIAINRVIGTFIGAAAGVLCSLIFPDNIFTIAVGIIILIQISNMININESISISALVFLAIMLSKSGDGALTYSINRILDTLIGIVAALTINYFIFPPRTIKVIKGMVNNLIDELREINFNEIPACDESCLKQLEDKITALNKEISLYQNNETLFKNSKEVIANIKDHSKIIINAVMHLKILNDLEKAYITERGSMQTEEVKDYHIQKIQQLIRSMKPEGI